MLYTLSGTLSQREDNLQILEHLIQTFLDRKIYEISINIANQVYFSKKVSPAVIKGVVVTRNLL